MNIDYCSGMSVALIVQTCCDRCQGELLIEFK